MYACQPVSREDIWALANLFFSVRFVAVIHPSSKVSEKVNRKLSAKNTMAQLLTLYSYRYPECHTT